jgi:uncharacterized membrane protein YdjX (TVP38/TMEM64 family)
VNKKVKRLLLYLGGALLLAAGALLAYPFLKMLDGEMTEERLMAVKTALDRLGAFKYLAVLLLQILQVLIAFLPGEPMEILAGYMCGTLGGLAVCLLGVAIGTAIIYLTVMNLGRRLVDRVGNSKPYEKLRFLKNKAARDGLLFLLFFIPGTPKDILTYIAGLTPIRLHQFLIISVFARLPSVITSTVGGNAMGLGNHLFAALVFTAALLISAAGVMIYRKIRKA